MQGLRAIQGSVTIEKVMINEVCDMNGEISRKHD